VNKKKNILILSPFFFPEPISTGKFNTDFALALANEGHDVTVLCFHPFYPNWKIKRSNKTLKNIKIVRGGKFLKFTKITILRRFILEFSFAFFLLRTIRKYQKNKDLIIPIFPPSFAFYSILRFIKKDIKKVGMVHDLQEIYSKDKKGLVNSLIHFFIHKIEKKCYQNCDKLIFLSKEMKDEAKNLYKLKFQKLEVQYPFITINNTITDDLGKLFDSSKKHVVYSGALGEKQNPIKLLEFFNKASKDLKDVHFHFFSQGSEINKLKSLNTNSGIFFHNLVEKENLAELYQRSDVQIIPQKAGTSKGSLPSKLPNLLSFNCKILLITDPESELDIFFKKNNLELVVTSWVINDLINGLKLLIEKDLNDNHPNEIAKIHFTIDGMIDKVLA
jgi:glycosyltransferase involved in cell wall biosynthesis